MKIVCLVKQVPNPAHIRLDPQSRTLVREGVPLEIADVGLVGDWRDALPPLAEALEAGL